MDCSPPGFSVLGISQEYWSGWPLLSSGDLPGPGIEPTSPALAGEFFITEPPGEPACHVVRCKQMLALLWLHLTGPPKCVNFVKRPLGPQWWWRQEEEGPRKPEGQDWKSVQREGALSVKETVVEAGVLQANLKSPPGRHPNSQASLGLPQALTEASASVSSLAQTSDRRLCWHLSFSWLGGDGSVSGLRSTVQEAPQAPHLEPGSLKGKYGLCTALLMESLTSVWIEVF